MAKADTILALDVGSARVGVAVANSIARLPSPLAILKNDDTVFDELEELINIHDVSTVVVGLPRNMKGEETRQSEISRRFASELAEKLKIETVFAEESLSSKRAEKEAKAMKRTQKHLDDIAACFILEEYLKENE